MDEATIDGRPGLDVDCVRAALEGFARGEGGLVRLDRPLRDVPGGRHFHVAAPRNGSGTLEVNYEPPNGGRSAVIRVVIREHWTGTWAGPATRRLVEHLAREVGALEVGALDGSSEPLVDDAPTRSKG